MNEETVPAKRYDDLLRDHHESLESWGKTIKLLDAAEPLALIASGGFGAIVTMLLSFGAREDAYPYFVVTGFFMLLLMLFGGRQLRKAVRAAA